MTESAAVPDIESNGVVILAVAKLKRGRQGSEDQRRQDISSEHPQEYDCIDAFQSSVSGHLQKEWRRGIRILSKRERCRGLVGAGRPVWRHPR